MKGQTINFNAKPRLSGGSFVFTIPVNFIQHELIDVDDEFRVILTSKGNRKWDIREKWPPKGSQKHKEIILLQL